MLVVGCSSNVQSSDAVSGDNTTTVFAATLPPSHLSTTTATTSSTTLLVTTTTVSASSTEFDDAELIMDLYAGWARAVAVGQSEIEAYLDVHIYPDLPRCAPGEKTLPAYTAQSDTIRPADEWTISWGPLDGTRPDGRVYEVQLSERDSPSHVAILHGVAYVFWNCRGDVLTVPPTTTDVWYAVDTPGYGPSATGDSDSAAGSGCNPGAATLPDGIWFGLIDEATADRISFDLACFWTAREYDDGLITNDSNRLRSVVVNPDAVAYQVVDIGGIGWVPMTYSEWLVAPPDEMLCSYPCDAAWLYVNDGAVTEVVQLFFP